MKAVATVTMNRVNVSNGEYARIAQGGNTRLGKHCFYRPTSKYAQT